MRTRVRINRDAVDTIAKSPAMQRLLAEQAQGIADRATALRHHTDMSPEFIVTDPEVQRRRARVAVVAKNWAARHEQAEHDTLTKGIGG